MRLDPCCPSCGGDLEVLDLRESTPHAHSTVSRCVLCSQQLVVRLHLTEVSRVHARDMEAPYAGLIDLIMATEAELLAERQLGVRAA